MSPPLLGEIRYFSSLPRWISIGQFSRLLLSLEMVAVSQAASPESNSNSPLLVTASRGHYPPNKLMSPRVDQCAGFAAGRVVSPNPRNASEDGWF